MTRPTILLLYGGTGLERDVSLLSAAYIETQLQSIGIQPLAAELADSGRLLGRDGSSYLLGARGVYSQERFISVDYAIPYIHGFPVETGHVQSQLELCGIPYFGSAAEPSAVCFNKVTFKLYMQLLGIPTVPAKILLDPTDLPTDAWLSDADAVFVKASQQGSSIGVYRATTPEQVRDAVADAFTLSPSVLIEPAVQGRELEVAVYEYDGRTLASEPGEIRCPRGGFYSHEEKYGANSKAEVLTNAEGLSPELSSLARRLSLEIFHKLRLRHLARVDFFLAEDGQLLVNEVNTHPGMSPISLFPRLLDAAGHSVARLLAGTLPPTDGGRDIR